MCHITVHDKKQAASRQVNQVLGHQVGVNALDQRAAAAAIAATAAATTTLLLLRPRGPKEHCVSVTRRTAAAAADAECGDAHTGHVTVTVMCAAVAGGAGVSCWGSLICQAAGGWVG